MKLFALGLVFFFALEVNATFLARGKAATQSSWQRSALRQRRSFDDPATITKFHVLSRVTTRYARVLVTSVLRNDDEVPKEVGMEMRLPKSAFISNFSMEIDGVVYVGIVKEKAAAKAEYKQAVAMGQSAGLVTANTRESQTFDVSVNIAAGGNVTFRLDYEELLKRKLGKYNHVIYADPGQIVDDFSIEVHINEPSGITFVEGRAAAGGKLHHGKSSELDAIADVRVRRSETQAFVSYEPTRKEQKKLAEFEVKYDVTRERLGGDLLIRNGYFVHFFAPSDLPVIPKKIVFVIDKSGSMSGRKIEQTKEALDTILDDLGPSDQFNIITFSDQAQSWQQGEMMSVSEHNIERAKQFVSRIRAYGGTNFNEAAQQGVSLLETVTSGEGSSQEQGSMIVLLTDGQPTVGETSPSEIARQLRESVNGRYSVFCLGFGSDVDHSFLDKLATENQGISRRIYADSDAALQLKGFYDEVASPMLAHVTFNYTGAPVVDVSETTFNNYFDGSEIMVVGRIDESALLERSARMPPVEAPQPDAQPLTYTNFQGTVGGTSIERTISIVAPGQPMEPTFADEGFDMKKIWAYLTVKQLLREKALANNNRKALIDSKVVALSLKYNFVTDLTSMVVTKPSGNPVLGGPGSRPQPGLEVEDVPQLMPRIMPPSFGRSLRPQRRKLHRQHFSLTSLNVQHSPPVSSRIYASRMMRGGRQRSRHGSRGRSGGRFYSLQPPPYHSLLRRRRPTTTTTTTAMPSTTPRATTTPAPVPPPEDPRTLQRTCGEDLDVSTSMNLTSPQHPGLYPKNSQCVWQFNKLAARSDNPTQLKLTFESLDVEEGHWCNYDRVLVYPDFDAANQQPEILTLCGQEAVPSIVRARERMLMVFQSDDVVEGRGFLANIQVEDVV